MAGQWSQRGPFLLDASFVWSRFLKKKIEYMIFMVGYSDCSAGGFSCEGLIARDSEHDFDGVATQRI